MKLGKLTMLSATALLAGGMSSRRRNPTWRPADRPPVRRAKPQGQCWDAASNTDQGQVRRARAAPRTPGGVTTGSSPSGQANNAKGTGDT